MKARDEIIGRMIEIEKELMHLSNDAQGNSDLWDAILKSAIPLLEAAYKNGGVINITEKAA